MKNRGHVNIAVADSLIDIKKDYKTKFSKERRRDNSIIGEHGINHIIIGRLYYGIYLLAKEKLGYSDDDRLNHRGNNSIWVELARHYHGTFRVNLTRGKKLAELRERFEYRSETNYPCLDTDVLEAKEYFNKIYRILQNETFIP